jgi:hypothetical protein
LVYLEFTVNVCAQLWMTCHKIYQSKLCVQEN